ncbi:exopolysaccharide biosynthesis polyprenyl glycosylphosphotransferase [Citricoccus sp. SGAir0253]|uniref:exopolysaccharide biosynthesis polyprenyl glycosylphosphotransferase n=1 Tax=Citricoccus sp. SGAir0253 TaxID=2567881 RepID=UPI00143DBEFF|nr:exopolysaccharide biosynthesis polyprenyl glycosylphosphotransferase [Citricoccus sp. SGAir0253]
MGTGLRAVDWQRSYVRRVLVTDLAVVVAAAGLVGPLYSVTGPAGGAPSPGMVAIVTLLWATMLQLSGTRSPWEVGIGTVEYRRVLVGTAAAAGMVAVVGVLGPGTGVRALLVLLFPLGLAGLLAGRWSWRSWLRRRRRQGHDLSDVVVVGPPADVRSVVRLVEREAAGAYRVVGVVLDGEVTLDDAVQDWGEVHRAACYVGLEEAEGAVRDLRAEALVITGPPCGDSRVVRELTRAVGPTGVAIILAPLVTGVPGPPSRVRTVGGLPLVHVGQSASEGARHVVKRAMDVVIASLALLVMLPLFAVIAVLVRRDSPGGVILAQTRTGRQGRPFRMYKFRTLVATGEERATPQATGEVEGSLSTPRQDPRVTRVGRVLRRHSLDDVPQFWNVLRGDMSIVGPPPSMPLEVTTSAGPERHRLDITPGMTGPWQVSRRSGLEWAENVRPDPRHAEDWSVLGDLSIMWRTVRVMIRPEGAS